MAHEPLSFRQILEAAQRLPAAEQRNLVRALAQNTSPQDVLKVAGRVRPAFRLSPRKRKRMSYLTSKRSQGSLTHAERAELNELVEETTENSIRMAEAITQAVEMLSQHNGMGRR